MKTVCWHRSTALIPALLLSAMLLTSPSWAGASEVGGRGGPSSVSPTLPGSTGANVGIVLQGVRFTPQEVTVRVGDTVTWTHRDSQLSHHVGAHDGSFDSHPTCGRPFGVCMKGGDTFSYTFRQAGTYEYHCRPHAASHHAGMVGTITVVE
jgi:plastocyanin